ncbi:MAG: zinc finger protein [archaeon GW2011_AR9]|nr:MAG: zinc finger protein [archaeon GW2011_AR9]
MFLKQSRLIPLMSEIKGQPCPFCNENKCTLKEDEVDIPYFGRLFVFVMECEGCGARKSDIEPAEPKEPCKYTLEVTSEDDLNIKIVKSGDATVKIPHIITIDAGPASEGYITNVEGLLDRIKKTIESTMEAEEDEIAKKKAKNMIKKINQVLVGRDTLKIIIEDETGHSAIISEKAQRSKL